MPTSRGGNIAIPAVLILATAGAIGLTTNGIRRDSVDLGKNYFEKPKIVRPTSAAPGTAPQIGAAEPDGPSIPAETPPEPPAADGEAVSPDPVTTPVRPRTQPPKPAKEPVHPDHGLQAVTVEQAAEWFNDPAMGEGRYVFVDARNDEHFETGHVPGAIQADHYQLHDYLADLLPAVEAAERIIVYCTGGDCEDSIFMCNDLLELGIPYEHLYLFEGGITEWREAELPIETGRR